MTQPEPLKGKRIELLNTAIVNDSLTLKRGSSIIVIQIKDIKSAVEWLKETIDSITYNEFLSKYKQELIKDEMKKFVDEAFEDVIEK